MTYTFESCFAARIEDFIAQKNALGFGYLESSRLLRDFDRFCMTHFPEENFLTEKLCLAWATKKDTEGNISQDATDEQFAAWCAAQPRVTAQGPNTITIKAAGTVPTIDIPVEVLIV